VNRTITICFFLVGWLAVALTAGCREPIRPSAPESVQVAGAASTRGVLEVIGKEFQRATGVEVQLSLGASSVLARQIEEGAPADILISADKDWAQHLADKNLVQAQRDLLTNVLAVIVPADSDEEVSRLSDLTLPAFKRIALAGQAVPAGRYARQALARTQVWDKIRDRVVDGGDVRAALTYVAQKEADAGLVYATDARSSSRVRLALAIRGDLHDPIRYPAVLIKKDVIKPTAQQFFEYLWSPSAKKVFQKAGFGVVD
jgi:molybdate transport system substrate-binding protein